jgi:glycosyltransferase involved in cell wall biosynthesis
MRISVLIPTRERAEYLASCLCTVTAISDPALEIIVSDNASLDSTRAVVEAARDARIRYVNTGRRLSMRQNFENAIRHASGEYVIVIGDDDAMLPGQFPVLRAVLERDRPECLFWRSRYFLWPDARQPDGGGRLKLTRAQMFGSPTALPTADILSRIVEARLGGHDAVPMIYHGAVRRGVIDKLVDKTGGVFLSSVPDVYFQVAALAVAETLNFIEHPFSIQAISPKSTGFSARFSSDGTDQAIAAFAREAEADPVEDPMPGKLPGIELYWLNALEQANRRAFGGTLPIRYDLYLDRAIRALERRSLAEFEAGMAVIRAFAKDLGGRADIAQVIASARPIGGMRRAVQSLDKQIRRFRRFQPSSMNAKQVIFDLRALGLGAVNDAAELTDFCLGSMGDGVFADAEALRASAMKRGRQLVWRALRRAGPPLEWGRAP